MDMTEGAGDAERMETSWEVCELAVALSKPKEECEKASSSSVSVCMRK
jgi:hypothetical protein